MTISLDQYDNIHSLAEQIRGLADILQVVSSEVETETLYQKDVQWLLYDLTDKLVQSIEKCREGKQ